jgi:hypothetical protein
LRCFEGEAHNAFAAVVREDRDFGRHGPWMQTVGGAAVSGVLAFGVLADYYPV